MIFRVLFSVALIFFSLPTFAIDRVVVTRYSTQVFQEGGQQLSWMKKGDYWDSDSRIGFHEYHDGTCRDLLTQQVMFSLLKMLKRGILTQAQVDLYSRLVSESAANPDAELVLLPEQISFFEYVSDLISGEPNSTASTSFQYGREEVKATMWSVSGQKLDLATGKMKYVALPWKLEKKFDYVKKKAILKKYKYFWEWGRGGQEKDLKNIDKDQGYFETLKKFGTMAEYRELLTYGGDVEEAAIIIHAISPGHTKLYLETWFAGTDAMQISDNDPKVGDSLLLVPMSAALQKHPLSLTSDFLARLKAAAGGQMLDSILTKVVEVYRSAAWGELDYYGPRFKSNQPLVIQNFSDWPSHSTFGQLVAVGFPPDRAKAMVEILRSKGFTTKIRSDLRYVDVSESKGASMISQQLKAIEASGLDPLQIKNDPFYLYRVLFGTAQMIIQQARNYAPRASLDDIEHLVLSQKTLVGFSTRNQDFDAVLRAMQPDLIKEVPPPIVDGPPAFFRMIADDIGQTSTLYYFDFATIFAMRDQHPELKKIYENAGSALRKGQNWQQQRLSDPDSY